MTLKFKVAIDEILKKIEVPYNVHQIFLNEVEQIVSVIYKTMQEKNYIFKNAFEDLKYCAFYLKEPKHFDLPVDFKCHLPIKLPFKVECLTVYDDNEPEFMRLKTKAVHPVVKNNYVDTELFNLLFETNLDNIINQIKPISCGNGRIYKLKYKLMNSNLNLHEIEAKLLNNNEAIIFNFINLLAFSINDYPYPMANEEFQYDKFWYAAKWTDSVLDIQDSSVWYPTTFPMQHLTILQKTQVRNIFRLLDRGILYAMHNNKFSRLICCCLISANSADLCKQPIHLALFYYLEEFMELEKSQKQALPGNHPVAKFYDLLKFYQLMDDVEFDELATLFGID